MPQKRSEGAALNSAEDHGAVVAQLPVHDRPHIHLCYLLTSETFEGHDF